MYIVRDVHVYSYIGWCDRHAAANGSAPLFSSSLPSVPSERDYKGTIVLSVLTGWGR